MGWLAPVKTRQSRAKEKAKEQERQRRELNRLKKSYIQRWDTTIQSTLRGIGKVYFATYSSHPLLMRWFGFGLWVGRTDTGLGAYWGVGESHQNGFVGANGRLYDSYAGDELIGCRFQVRLQEANWGSGLKPAFVFAVQGKGQNWDLKISADKFNEEWLREQLVKVA